MTPEQLAEIRARAEAATPGPWGFGWVDRLRQSPADCDFIARARTDIPALLDYIEELQARLAQCPVCGALPGEVHGEEHRRQRQ